MTIDATKPEDSVHVSELPAYIRANRVEINSVSVTGTGAVGASAVDLAGGTILTIGVDLSLEGFETVVLTQSGMSDLTTILNGIQGQIKMFVCTPIGASFQDSVTRLNGTLDLNESPAGAVYMPLTDGEVITLVNIGGDGGLTTHGYWREVDRAANV